MTSKERARLRGLANGIETVLQIGKDGIGENLIHQADITLEARELMKGRVLDGCILSPREAAEALAKATDSEVVQVIGSTFALYRKKKSAEKEKKASKPRNPERRKPSRTNHDEPRKSFNRPGQRDGVKSGGPNAAQRKAVRPGQRKPLQAGRSGQENANAGQRKPLQAGRSGQQNANAGQRKPLQSGRPEPRKPLQANRAGQRKPFNRPGPRKARDGGNKRK